jgi:hypothetical protein
VPDPAAASRPVRTVRRSPAAARTRTAQRYRSCTTTPSCCHGRAAGRVRRTARAEVRIAWKDEPHHVVQIRVSQPRTMAGSSTSYGGDVTAPSALTLPGHEPPARRRLEPQTAPARIRHARNRTGLKHERGTQGAGTTLGV